MGDWEIERGGKESKWETDLCVKYIDVEELRWRKREESQEEIESRSDWRKDMLEGLKEKRRDQINK